MIPRIMRPPDNVVNKKQETYSVICARYQIEIIEKIRITSYYNALEKNC